MKPICTLPGPIQALMRGAPLLRYTHHVSDEFHLGRYPEEHAHIERRVRAQAARELGEKCLEKATEERTYETFSRAYRTDFQVVVMSEAELAVLLARAYEQGRF